MNYQHKDLTLGRWSQLSFLEQMANIGSEVERALNWRIKKNTDYAQKAFERALELIDLTLDNDRNYAHLKEITRMREAIVDYFSGVNHCYIEMTVYYLTRTDAMIFLEGIVR